MVMANAAASASRAQRNGFGSPMSNFTSPIMFEITKVPVPGRTT
jgi:hypothetical protein